MKQYHLKDFNQKREDEKKYFVNYFKDKTVSHHNVIEEFCRLRGVENVEDIKKDK